MTLTRRKPIRRRIDYSRAIALYRQGMTQTEVAKKVGCNSATLSRYFRSVGIPTPPPAAKPLDADEVIRRYENLEGYVHIATDLGVSTVRVKNLLESRGIVRRGSGHPKGRPGKKRPGGYGNEFRQMLIPLRERSGGKCEATISPNCTGQGTHGHHRKLRSQGGLNNLETLLDTCVNCHMWIHHNPSLARGLGLLVRSTDDPALVPVVPVEERGPNPHLPSHCQRGHEFTPENTRTRANGVRECRTCHRALRQSQPSYIESLSEAERRRRVIHDRPEQSYAAGYLLRGVK